MASHAFSVSAAWDDGAIIFRYVSLLFLPAISTVGPPSLLNCRVKKPKHCLSSFAQWRLSARCSGGRRGRAGGGGERREGEVKEDDVPVCSGCQCLAVKFFAHSSLIFLFFVMYLSSNLRDFGFVLTGLDVFGGGLVNPAASNKFYSFSHLSLDF